MKANRLTKETISQIGLKDSPMPDFREGDTVAVSLRIKEGEKERLQIFQGDVIAIHRNGASSTFTVRKMAANSISVEKILPYHSPLVHEIKVLKRGDVRRAKLYYIRDRVGKAARIKEKILTKEQIAAKKKKDEAKSGKKQETAVKKVVAKTEETKK